MKGAGEGKADKKEKAEAGKPDEEMPDAKSAEAVQPSSRPRKSIDTRTPKPKDDPKVIFCELDTHRAHLVYAIHMNVPFETCNLHITLISETVQFTQ